MQLHFHPDQNSSHILLLGFRPSSIRGCDNLVLRTAASASFNAVVACNVVADRHECNLQNTHRLLHPAVVYDVYHTRACCSRARRGLLRWYDSHDMGVAQCSSCRISHSLQHAVKHHCATADPFALPADASSPIASTPQRKATGASTPKMPPRE